MKRSILLLGLFFAFVVNVIAQDVPVSNVYAFTMKKTDETTYNFSNPKYLTAFNRNGYNNQPSFIEPNLLYLTVQLLDESQTDIYALDLNKMVKTKVTATTEGEYSPTLMPTGGSFSSVRVEADGQGTQRLWKFPLDRLDQGEPVFKNIKGVGYHYWLNQYKAALFIVGQPSKLVLANTLTGSTIELMDNIGRGMQRLSGDNLAFIHKTNDQTWMLKEIDTYTYRTKDLVKTLPNSEDFILTDDGTYIMGNGSKLYKFNKYGNDQDWVEIADFQYYGIRNITRLALSSNGTIAIVDRIK